MAANFPIKVKVDDAELKALIDLAAKLGGATKEAIAASSKATQESAKTTAAVIKATLNETKQENDKVKQAIAAASERYGKLEEQFAGKKTKDIYEHERKLKQQKEELQNASTATFDRETKKEIALQKAAVDAELRDLKRLREEKEHNMSLPQKIGAAGKNFLLGEGGTGEAGGGLAGGGALGGMMGNTMALGGIATGVAGATMALEKLFDAGKEAKEREEEITIGLRSMGMSAEEAAKATETVVKSSKDVSNELAINHAEVEKATAAYLKMGGTTDNLKEKQEDIAALSKKAGVDMEQAAKMYAKAGDPEVAGNLKKFGIVLDANMTTAERSAKIHEKLAGTLDGMKEAANGPLGAFNRMKEVADQLMESLGGVVFGVISPLIGIASNLLTVLQPVIDIISDLGKQVGEVIADAFQPFQQLLAGLKPIIEGVAKVIGVVLKVAIEYIVAPIRIMSSLWSALITTVIDVVKWLDEVTGVSKFLVDAFNVVSKAVNDAIEWFHKALDTIKNVGSTILGLIGIHVDLKKGTEGSTEATKKNSEALQANAKAAEDANAAQKDLLDTQRKNIETSKDTWARQQAILQSGVENGRAITAERRKQLEDNNASQAAFIKGQSEQLAEFNEIKDKADQFDLTKNSGDTKAKKVKDTSIKEAKDLYASLKQEADNAYAKERVDLTDDLLNKRITKEKFQQQELEKEVTYRKKLLDLAQDKRFEKTHYSDMLSAESAYQSSRLKLEATTQSEADAITAADIKEAKDAAAEKEKLSKREAILKQEIEKAKIDAMQSGTSKELALIQYEYDKELETRANDIKDLANGEELKNQIRNKYAAKYVAVMEKAEEKVKQERDKQFQQMSAPFQQAFGNAAKVAEDKLFTPLVNKWHLQKTVGGQALTSIAQGFIKMGEEWIMQQGLMLAKNLLFSTTTAATTTAAMDVIAASAVPAATAVSIASFGSADATGLTAMLTALASTKGAFAAATKFAEGGIAMNPIFGRMMNGGPTVAGEAGPELIAPLSQLPNILARVMPVQQLSSLAVNQNGALIHEMRNMRSEMVAMHQTFKQRPEPIIQDMNKTQISLNQAQLRVQRAKM